MASQSFAQLVSLACHDLRTPLATASGFARTLERLDKLGHPADRYVEMIGAATDQLSELLDLLSVAARIEADRFEPRLRRTSTRELADAAAARIEDGRASVEGDGVEVRADPDWGATSLSALAEAARRHGGLESITITAAGATIAIAPIVDDAGAIALGDDLRDFAAAVGARVLQTGGAMLELAGDRLHVHFPQL
ncbi:MAG TPA: histidine kinase dimerization/phospho-acceptor domain-containing protein [Gaiellaceae bacterium]|nr:histidine kinase dimerization/phospho-acceptor domain-containing protein [Gaiellaceae bacterium]